jgi:hypothetical protein
MFVEFKNGSKIELKGSDYPDSLRGVGLDGVVLDEYSMQDPAIFTEIIRPALADKQGWSVKISTPKGRNHFHEDWVMSGGRFNFKASETGVIPKEELEQLKKEMSEEEYQQEFENAFLYFSGQIYREFKKEVHVIEPKEVIGERMISIDHGLRNPTAVGFYTIDHDDNVYLTDEIYEAGLEVQDTAQRIKDKWQDKQSLPSGVIDPSTAAKDRFKKGIPYSVFLEFLDNGIQLALAPNNVLAGINIVKQAFTNNKFFIFKRCEKTIWELENYRWKDRRSSDANLPEQPLKVRDHSCDQIRYLHASRFNGGELPIKPLPAFSADYFEQLNKMQYGVKEGVNWV